MFDRQYLVANLAWTSVPNKLELRHNHLLIVDEQGYIAFSGPFDSEEARDVLKNDKVEVKDVERLSPLGFLFPAFVDLHLHAPQYLYAGTGLGLPLMQWLDKHAFEAEKQIDGDITLAHKVYERLCHQLIENGIGTTLLFGTISSESNCELGRCFQLAGLRAFVGKLSMDLNAPSDYIESSAAQSLAESRNFCLEHLPKALLQDKQEESRQQLVWPVVTPRFIPTCSDGLLQGLGSLVQEHQLTIQSHMCESADEVAWVQSTRGGKSDAEIFDQAGLLGSTTIMAHCTSLSPPERDLLIKRGSAVASCPISNAYFSDRPFAMRESIDEGLKVGLGSDVAGGYTLDMMQVMRSAVLVSKLRNQENQLTNPDCPTKDITWIESLYLATKGGASALSPPLHPLHGTFEVGAPFDAQFIQTRQEDDGAGIGNISYFTSHWDLQEAVEKWYTMGDVRNRRHFWVAARRLK
jgi:guanine deaminase